MLNEHLVLSPNPSPTFRDYFAQYNRNFFEAAHAYARAQADQWQYILPISLVNFEKQVFPLVDAAITIFDNDVLSERWFPILTPHLKHAASIICWTEGDPKIQAAKVEALRRIWETMGIDRNSVLLLSSEAKMGEIGNIIMSADSIGERKFPERKEKLDIVVVEDKITNMMKFVDAYIRSHPGVETGIPVANEDSLDSPDFQFDDFLDMWTLAIERNFNNFERFSFVYVPPGKQEGQMEILNISDLRRQRVFRWIEESNKAISRARAQAKMKRWNNASPAGKLKIKGEGLMSDAKQRFADPQTTTPLSDKFFHIESDNTDLRRIITPETIVAQDVDGPLIKQKSVLLSREALLQAAFREVIDQSYREIFGVGVEEMAKFILDPTTKPGIISENHQLLLIADITNQEIAKKCIRTLFKDRIGTNMRLTIQKFEDNKSPHVDTVFEYNPILYKQTLESLGYQFSGTDMLQ